MLYALEHFDVNLDVYTSTHKNISPALNETDIWTLLSNISQALSHLLREGKHHGDLRSKNVQVASRTCYKIIDPDLIQQSFSSFHRISMILHNSPMAPSSTLSGFYIAPEQISELNKQ